MLVIDFKKLSNLLSIAINFNTSKSFLQNVIDSQHLGTIYEEMHIPKKRISSSFRTVYKANKQLGSFHKNLLVGIENYIFKNNKNTWIHDSVHGFIKKKNTFSNANIHLNKNTLIQVDIKDFFKSISIDDVAEVFFKLCENKDMSFVLAKLTTINGALGEGLHTSPLLANLFFYDFDIKLNNVAYLFNCDYTRYADDITFSTNMDIKGSDILNAIASVFLNSPFTLNSKKTRISKKGQPQYVTGLSISNSSFPRIPRHIKKLIRQELFYMKTLGLEKHFARKNEPSIDGLQRLSGWIVYCFAIEPELAKKFQAQLDSIVGDRISIYNKRSKKKVRKSTSLLMYFDETKYKNYFGLSCVLVEEPYSSSIIDVISSLYEEIYADQYMNTKEEKIFHYCEDNIDIKNKIIECLRRLEFNTYIAFFRLGETDYTEDDYLKVFYKLIFDRVHSQYDSSIKINYEENSKIKHKNILKKLQQIHLDFSNQNMPFLDIVAEKVTKDDKMTVISDYMLGIFKDAFLKGDTTKDFEKLNYKKLGTKVRLIVDLDNQEYYSRYNPLSKISV